MRLDVVGERCVVQENKIKRRITGSLPTRHLRRGQTKKRTDSKVQGSSQFNTRLLLLQCTLITRSKTYFKQ